MTADVGFYILRLFYTFATADDRLAKFETSPAKLRCRWAERELLRLATNYSRRGDHLDQTRLDRAEL